jgi:hypothetical protein
MPTDMEDRTDEEIMQTLYNEDEAIGFSLSRFSAGSENERLRVPLANILVASPYIVVHSMHHLHNLHNSLPHLLHRIYCTRHSVIRVPV